MAHGVYCHNVADRGETPSNSLTNDSKATAKGHDNQWEEFAKLWPELMVQSGYDSLQNTERVDNVLTKLLLNEVVHLFR